MYNVNSYVVSDTVQNQMMANFKNNAKEYIGVELYHKTGEVNRISKKGNPYTLILSALNDGATIDPKDKSDFGDLSDKSIGTETKAVKTGKKSNVEKAAIVSGYTGDLNKLQYTGTSEELKQPWADYTKNKKSSPFFASKLSPKSSQPNPKIQRSTGSGKPAFSNSDTKLAQTDPRAFQAKHAQEFQEISDMATKAGVRLSTNKLMGLITSGQVSSMDELKQAVQSFLNRK